jgi:lipoprotein-releasing system permease protein
MSELPADAPTEIHPSPEPPRVRFDALPPVTHGSTFGTEWWIAWSHLRSKKSDAFLSITTLLSILGVTAGVAMLNWVISVMTGFEDDLREKILGANAHVVVFRLGGNLIDVEETVRKVEGVAGVEAASPFVYTEMMLRSPWSGTGIVLKGIDPARTGRVTHLQQDLVEGYDPAHARLVTYDDGDDETRKRVIESMGAEFPPIGLDNAPLPPTAEEPLLPGIIIGKELRDHLQIRPGDKVQIVNPLGGGSGPMGVPVPSIKSVRVAAVFDSGMFEYDTKWAYLANPVAQGLLQMNDEVTGIEVRASDVDDVERLAADIDLVLGYPHYARHWKSLNAKLFSALELEKWVMGLLLNMIVVNAGLLIVTTLIMMVITKGREIAILKAMGATDGSIVRIFVMEGAAIGLVGTLLGTAFGLLGCWFLDRYEYPLETDVYYLDTLPVVVDPWAVLTIAAVAFVVCFFCTIYPAWRAGRLDPVEALRYE